VSRIVATEVALALVRDLTRENGPLLFHQSGGCCDGSAPMCFKVGDFRIGSRDVFLGMVEDTPFYMGAAQFEYWKHTRLVLDVVPGRGAGFSLESPLGVRFLIRSEILTIEEIEVLGEPATGPLPRP
jgi:hypothetical protein